MIKCSYQRLLFNITHIWFSKEVIKNIKCDIAYFHGIKDNTYIKNCFSWKQPSLITDLNQSEDNLFSLIKKNYRYDIKRSQKDGTYCKMYKSQEFLANEELICVFENTFNEMFKSKGMKDVFNRRLFIQYLKNNSLAVSIGYHNNIPLVFHSYVIDGDNVRFFYSCSPFRQEKKMSELIGRLNKALHWFDIKEFKSDSKKKYDWGGVFDFDKPNGIDSFKMSFGGKPITYFNYIVGISLIGKIAILLLKLKNKFIR